MRENNTDEAQPSAPKAEQSSLIILTEDSFPKKKTLIIATTLGIISTIHCYLFNLGVKYTSVVSNFIIHDTSEVFVFIFCLLLLGWKFSWIRLLAVVISVVGVLFIGYSDSSDTQQESALFGDMFSLISTSAYTLLITMTRMYVEDENAIDWNLYFYYIGITTAVLWFPVLLFLHFTGIEPFLMPNGPTIVLLIIEGFIGYILPNYTVSLSTVLLDPLITDLGLGAITPLSMLIDHYYEGKKLDLIYMSGYGFILGAFLLLAAYDFMNEDPAEKPRKLSQASQASRELVKFLE